MLFKLLKISTSALFSGFLTGSEKKSMKKSKVILYAILITYTVAIFMWVFAVFFNKICSAFVETGLGWLYFALMGLMIFLLCFIGSVFTTQNQIFEAKDNELLLAMPIKPSSILLSKMVSLMGLNLTLELMVFIPAAVVYIINQGFSAASLIIMILSLLLLPVMVMAVSAMAGWLIALVSSRMKRKNLAVITLSVILFMGYMYMCFMWQRYLGVLVENGEVIGEVIRKALMPFYYLGTGIYEGSFADFGIFALFAIIPFAAVYYVISSCFIRIATANRGGKKIKYKAKALKVRGSKQALIRKDIAYFLGSPTYMFNAGIGLVFMPIVAVILRYQAGKGDIAQIAAVLDPSGTMTGAVLCVIMGFLASMVTISAPGISLEGKTLWILKSLPLKEGDLLMTKAWTHVVISLPFILISAAVLELSFSMSIIGRIMVVAVPLALTVFFALLGVIMNVIFPKLDWANETAAVKQGMSVFITMTVGMIAVAAPTALYIFAIRKTGLTADRYTVAVFAFFALLSAVLIYLIRTAGVRMWNRLAG